MCWIAHGFCAGPFRLMQMCWADSVSGGRWASEIISALKIIAEEQWKEIAWIESAEGIAIEAENLKRGGQVGNTNAANETNGRIVTISTDERPHRDDAAGIKRRLSRKRPELLDAVVTGKMSANAAAIAVGMRKPMWSAPVSSPEVLAAAIVRKFDAEFVNALKAAL